MENNNTLEKLFGGTHKGEKWEVFLEERNPDKEIINFYFVKNGKEIPFYITLEELIDRASAYDWVLGMRQTKDEKELADEKPR